MKSLSDQGAVPCGICVGVDVVLFCIGLAVVLSVPDLSDVAAMWIPIVILVGVLLSAPLSQGIWLLLGPKRAEIAPPPPPSPPTPLRLLVRNPPRERAY